MLGEVSFGPFKNSQQVSPSSTAIVWNTHLPHGEQVCQDIRSHPGIKIAVVDVVAQRDVGQEPGVPVDLLSGKQEGQDEPEPCGPFPNNKRTVASLLVESSGFSVGSELWLLPNQLWHVAGESRLRA